jgi:AraC-like DNA-binding protein
VLSVFDSAMIAAAERLEAWREITATSLLPTQLDVADPAAFVARLDVMPLGAAQVASMTYTALSSRRTARDIHRSDPEYYHVGLTRTGRQGLTQNGSSVVLHQGDLVLYDSSRPFEALVGADCPTQTVQLQIPRSMLPLRERRVSDLCAVALPKADGVGHVLAAFLTSLADGRTRCTARDTQRLESIAVDLATAMLAHHLERDSPPLRSPTHTLYLQILAFIDDNLHNPDLPPATIAAAHRICLRYLHRIFKDHHHVSVATHVRTRRLDRARRDLIDPRLGHLTIAAVARRWGFVRPADFSRDFRRHTGIAPGDYRNEMTRRPDPAG